MRALFTPPSLRSTGFEVSDIEQNPSGCRTILSDSHIAEPRRGLRGSGGYDSIRNIAHRLRPSVNVADTVPRYDMKPTCRAAVDMMGNQGRTVESCMSGEERARKDLEKDWSKYPSAERTQCAAPMANNRSPSYVELLICLEMMGDSRKHRDEEQAASKSKKSTSKP